MKPISLSSFFADVDLVAVRDELVVDEVLEHVRQISATPAVDGVEETDVGEVTFFLGFVAFFLVWKESCGGA